MEFFSSNRRHISRRTLETPDMRRLYLKADYEPKEVTCNYYLFGNIYYFKRSKYMRKPSKCEFLGGHTQHIYELFSFSNAVKWMLIRNPSFSLCYCK